MRHIRGPGEVMKAKLSGRHLNADGPAGVLADTYRQHWHALCRHVRRNFGPGPPEPEDVAQAAFARFAAIEDKAVVANPGAFLRRIAHNIVIDAHRRDGRTRRIAHDLEILDAENSDLSPEDVLVSKEELERLNDVIASLKPKYRVALMLHRMDGLTFVEVAREMGVSVSGARLLVSTALADCAAAMGKRQ